MNRGNIPGYYWDEEKKKYFKIQANHLVPQFAKYGKGTVKRENRLAKKRKTEEQKRHRRERQIIKPAPVLKSSAIGGVGLVREHGLSPNTNRLLASSESALVSQWVPERIEIKLPRASQETRVQDAHYIPAGKRMAIASTHSGVGVLYSANWERDASCDEGPVKISGRGIAAFNSSIASISSGSRGQDHFVLACAEQPQAGGVYVSLLPDQTVDFPEHLLPAGIYLTVGPPGTVFGDTAMHPRSGTAAIIGTTGTHIIEVQSIYVVDIQAAAVNVRLSAKSELDQRGCADCINWLDSNTVLYGSGGKVMLWDTRTRDGRTARFSVRGRMTGVFNPSQPGSSSSNSSSGSPHEILASTNHSIHLFDTRMPRSTAKQENPVLSIPHVHGGPRLQNAAKGSLVAAVDRDNIVQVYSTRSGAKASSLKSPPWQHRRLESPALRKLMWYDDDERGSTLQAVQGNGVVRWTWGGVDDERDEIES